MTLLVSKEKRDKLVDTMDWRDVRFCHEYLLDQNSFEASKRAGYEESEALNEANRLMNNPDALLLINSLAASGGVHLKMNKEDEINEEINIDKTFIIERLARIADYNSQTIKDEHMTRSGDRIIKDKMRDPNSALKALELLGKTKAMFVDKKEVDVGNDMAQLIREARERAGIMQSCREDMNTIEHE